MQKENETRRASWDSGAAATATSSGAAGSTAAVPTARKLSRPTALITGLGPITEPHRYHFDASGVAWPAELHQRSKRS